MADRIRELRQKRHLRQHEVAAALGIPPSTYSAYETGRIPWTCELVIKLVCFYGVNADYLVGLTDISTPYPPPRPR